MASSASCSSEALCSRVSSVANSGKIAAPDCVPILLCCSRVEHQKTGGREHASRLARERGQIEVMDRVEAGDGITARVVERERLDGADEAARTGVGEPVVPLGSQHGRTSIEADGKNVGGTR